MKITIDGKAFSGDEVRRLLASASDRPLRLTGAATLAPADGKALRKFRMAAYNGGVYRFPWSQYPVVLDLAGLDLTSKARPILKDHDPGRVVGHSENIVNDGRTLTVDGIVSGTGPAAQEVVANSDNGFPWQASIGADILGIEEIAAGQVVEINGQSFTGPLTVVRSSRLGEVSFVALGNDDSTHAAMTAAKNQPLPVQGQPMNFEDWLKSLGLDPATLTEEAKAVLQQAYDAEKAASDAAAAKAADAPEKAKAAKAALVLAIQAAAKSAAPAKPAQVPAHIAAAREQAAVEAERLAAIGEVCVGHAKIQAQAIREGWSKDRAELEVLRASRTSAPAIGSSMAPVTATVLEAAVALSGRLAGAEKKFDAPTLEAAHKRFKGRLGLQELLLEAAWANGYTGRSFRQDMAGVLRAAFALQAGSFSTVDIGGILSNNANKFLLEGYMAVEPSWREIAAIRPVSDLKTSTSYRLTGNQQYEKVGPTGEIKHGTLVDQGFTNKADTYGKILGVSRADMINDDLGSLTAVPRLLGRGSALKLNDVFWTAFLDNAAFFVAGNNNYLSGATSSLLTIDGLTNAEVLFRNQTDADGKPLGIAPAFLVVPPALSAQASALFNSLELRDTTANTKAPTGNPHAGKFKPVVSAYLSNASYPGYSALAWYMVANPSDLAAIEVAFLNGQESPTVETSDADFSTLGIQMRGFHDFGVAKQDFRAGIKSKGAA